MVLEEEIAQYEKDLPDILKNHENEFVVYKGKDRLGFYKTLNDALNAGYKTYGYVDFLARQVLKTQPVYRIRPRIKVVEDEKNNPQN